MVQLGNDVATRDVPTNSWREEFVSHMELRWRRNDAATRGVPHIPGGKEEFVRGIVRKVEMMQPRRMYEGGEEESEER